ncbi:MAG: YgjV family protein [Clostridia bacterium]|nr:YgjV family protein [Clostridia bacterium]
MQIASLIVGIGAVALYLLCFQLKRAKAIIACRFLSSILYVLQYLLLFALVGAAMDASAAIANGIAYKKDTPFVKRWRVPIVILINSMIVVVGLLLYESPISLLPIIAAVLESTSNWMKNEKWLRIVSFISVPFWLVYNAICGAYAAVLGSALAMVSIISALVRYSGIDKSEAEDEKLPRLSN